MAATPCGDQGSRFRITERRRLSAFVLLRFERQLAQDRARDRDRAPGDPGWRFGRLIGGSGERMSDQHEALFVSRHGDEIG